MKALQYHRTLCPLLLAAGLIMPSTALTSPTLSNTIPLTEDLMCEHGLLHRLLSIYDELANRLTHHTPFKRAIVEDAVSIVQNFIENHHEKLEEEFIFPKFNKFTSKYRSLVKTLEQQHNIGRKLTARIKEIALHDDIFNKPAYKMQLLALLKAYSSMFRVHTSREDTELFPHVRSLMTAVNFASLSRIFEEREEERFGKKGFQLMLDRVIFIEKRLGIYHIDRFNANVR